MSHNEEPATNPGLKKHSIFFIEAEMVTIQVEDTLFNVHKQQLQRSGTFRDMFTLGNQNGLTPEGFKRPLSVVALILKPYTSECSKCDNQPFMRRVQAIEPDRIRSALRLADMWDFTHHRDYLLEVAFNTFDIVDQIVLAEQFNVRNRVQPLYLNLCQRHEPLTLEEARKLGLEGTALVGRLRERLCRRIPPPVVTQRQGHPHGWAAVIAAHAALQRLAGPEELNPLPSGEADTQFLKKGIQDWFNSGL
ncbi:hypothetical protein FRC10_011859 [Ceratobasidium sp. 414]|nr:hypothetical protein FRC10_011859 [Ceratobasidium sp. 414]